LAQIEAESSVNL